MRFWAAPLIILLALAMFIACGDETTSVTETPAMSVVESGKKMVVCSDDNAGDIVYVKDSSAVFYCADGEWQTLNGKDGTDGKEGAQGKDGSSVKDSVVIRDTIFVTERDTVLLLSYDTLVVINRDTVYIQEPASSNSDISSSSQITEVPEGYMRDSRDGRLYKTVQISNQLWMAENMKLDVNDAYCYNDVKENCEKYGMLYTATTAKRVCPDGWQLPVWDDWYTLLYNISDFFNTFKSDFDYVFKDKTTMSKLRSTKGWNTENGNDSVGLSAYPVGILKSGNYTGFGSSTCFMEEIFDTHFGKVCLNSNDLRLSYEYSSIEAVSVRCLKFLPLEDAYGKCDDSSDGKMSNDGLYVCANSNWRKTSLLEKEIGTCSSKNEGDVKEGYTCTSGVWYGSLTDSRDGKIYRTVMIGNQTWMAEDLNNSNGAGNTCPDGWRVPVDWEWANLFFFVGGRSIAGKMLKSVAEGNRQSKGIDLYGFTVLPNIDGFYDEHQRKVIACYAISFLTTAVFYDDDHVDFLPEIESCSTRCVKDEETAGPED